MGDDGVKDDGLIRKQEEDYTKQVDEALPKAVALASSGKLHDAVESLLPLEKKARIANDSLSTTRLLEAIVGLCWDANDLKALGEYLTLLSKRRGQLKQAVTKMVQRACDCVDKIADKEERVKLIELLRTVTAGKIHVELERARLTKKLADIKEADGQISEAADILQDLQVETFGSMDKREKVEFILEQMRLGLLRKDFIRTQIISKKISTRFFKDENTHELKLKYYDLMMQLADNDRSYLDMAKYCREVFDTPQIQKDPARSQPVVRDTVFYLVLAPFGNEQSDLAARVREEKSLKQVPIAEELLKVFSTDEVVQWKNFEAQFAEAVRATSVFAQTEAGTLRWADLKKRLIEHNIRVISQYYTRISLGRLQELLDLPTAQVEEYLSNLVTNKIIFAKIDRPAGIASFSRSKAPADVLNEWASGISSLMRLVDKTTHLIAKERMVHKV